MKTPHSLKSLLPQSPPFSVSTKFIISGLGVNPKSISRDLGLTPDWSHRKGEKAKPFSRLWMARKSSGATVGTYESGLWEKYIGRRYAKKKLAEQLEYWTTILVKRKAILEEYRRKKYGCSLVCDINNNALLRSINFAMPASLQKKLVACNVDLTFKARTDIFIVDQAFEEGMALLRKRAGQRGNQISVSI